jgi:hypothetical protein
LKKETNVDPRNREAKITPFPLPKVIPVAKLSAS